MRKSLLAVAMAGEPVLLLDNVTGKLASVSLESFVTAHTVTGRKLGTSEAVKATKDTLVLVTGNSVVFNDDMTRRAVVAELSVEGNPAGRVIENRLDEHRMLSALKEYIQTHGSCLVPQRWVGDRALAEWVSNQRSAYRRNLLDPALAKRLDELGFTWDPVSTWWENKFQQLLEFKKKHGHTNVPQKSPAYPELATWVHNQRHAKRNNRPIMAEREKRLDEIGFAWRLVEPNVWEQMFERLLKFKKAHGHCNVPQKGGTDRKLGRWVNVQRLFHMRGKIRTERRKQLEAVGFV